MSAIKKIGIVGGTGMVGTALAVGFIKAGYEVKVGTRDAKSEKVAAWLKENPKVQVGSQDEAAKFGDAVVIVSLWQNMEALIKQVNKENLKGKVVLDINNPLNVDLAKMHSELIPGVCVGKSIQGWVPEAHVVKFLNSVRFNMFCFPYEKNGIKPATFIAGNNAASKKTATDILVSLGWTREFVIDAGNIEAAVQVEALSALWVNAAFDYPEFQMQHNWAFLTK